MDDTQQLYNVIAILTKRLGGTVVIGNEELRDPPEGIVTRNDIQQQIIIEVKT